MKHKRLIFELGMTILVGIDVVLLGYELWGNLGHTEVFWIEQFDLAVALIFLTEFLVLMLASRRPLHYLRQHWLLLIAAIPLAVPGSQLLRLLRLVRLVDHVMYIARTKP